MALSCQMSLNTPTYSAGASPSPQATLFVFNPNASPVAVTTVQLTFFDVLGNFVNAAVNAPMPAMGPGQTVVVPALGSLSFGPFPIAVGSGANGSSFLALPAAIGNSQLAEKDSYQLFVGAVVGGSDGSINTAGSAGLVVSYTAVPPLGTQGGTAQFNAPRNAVVSVAVL